MRLDHALRITLSIVGLLLGFCLQAADQLAPPPQEWALKFMKVHAAVAPSPEAFNLGAEFTLETWVFLEGESPGTIILGKGHNAAGDNPWVSYGLTFAFEPGRRVQFAQTAGAGGSLRILESPDDIPLRTWTHVTGVLDGGNMRLYVNGEEVAQGASAGAPESNAIPFALGGWPQGIAQAMWGFLNGSLRQARVWNRALGAEEIKKFATQVLTGTEPGLVACWPLDDGRDEGSARDAGPNHLPLALETRDPRYKPALWIHTHVLDTGPYFQVEHFADMVAGPGCGFGPLSPMDFDHDGLMDLLAETVQGGSLGAIPYRALRNDGTSHFKDVSDSVFLPAAPSPYGVSDPIVADFDGDGVQDLFLPDYGLDWTPETPGQALLFLGNSDGHLADATTTHLPQETNKPHDAAAGDFRGLGLPDIFIGNIGVPPEYLGHGSELYLNDGHGHFTRDISLLPTEARGYYTGSIFLDADKDGHLDLWLGSGEPQSFPDKIELNLGRGILRTAPLYALPPLRSGALEMSLYGTTADLDGDSWPDLLFDVILNYDNARHLFRALLNNGDGTFREASDRVPNRVQDTFGRHVVGDFNADGRTDLALTVIAPDCSWTPQTRLFLNLGRGQFLDETELLGFDTIASGQVAADFNNDGLMDLINFYSDLALAKAMKPFVPPVEWTRNFTLDPSPTKLFLRPGEAGSFDALVRGLNGFTGSAAVTAILSPASPYVSIAVPGSHVTLDGGAPVRVTAAPNAPVGVYWLWITAESNGISHTTSLPVIVYRLDASVGPSSESDPLSIAFSAEVEGFDGLKGAPSFDWDYGDGSPHGTSASGTHTYSGAGTYTWTATISNGLATRTHTGTATVPWECTLSGTASASEERGNAPLGVVFTAQANPFFCSGADPVYRWDFGDGTFSVEQNPNKIYGIPGTYPWTVTVTAAGKRWSRSGWVTAGGLPGQAGALRFKGGEVAQAGSSPLLDLGAAYTVESWLYLPELPLPDRGTILARRWEDLGGTPSLSFALDVISDGRPQFQQCGASGSICSAPYSESSVGERRGVHMAATNDGTDLKLYVNGAVVGSGPSFGAPGPTPVPFAIGASAHADGTLGWAPLIGLLWDIRVWDRALSQEEIAAGMGQRLTGNEPGLIAWWPLDDDTGQVANDHGPNHLNLTLGTAPGEDPADPVWLDLTIPCKVSCVAACGSTSPVLQSPVSFTSSASAEGLCGTGTVAFEWDFGDGSDPSPEPSPTHIFGAAGHYIWTLTASSGGTSCVRTGTVTVTSGPPGDCDGGGTISIGEVQKAINMFLGVVPPACGVDCNVDGAISIGEVQKVINGFLGLMPSCG